MSRSENHPLYIYICVVCIDYRLDVCRYYFYLHTDEDLLGCLKFNYWDIDKYYPGKRPETVWGSRKIKNFSLADDDDDDDDDGGDDDGDDDDDDDDTRRGPD